jgi:hypothetical protein
VGHSR